MNTESKPELTNKEIGYFYNLVCHALMDVNYRYYLGES